MHEPQFERLGPERSASPRVTESLLGTVVKVSEPPSPGMVQVRLFGYHGPTEQDATVWARVAVPVAGARLGTFLLPDVDDEVLVTFAGGDPRFPIVVGSLWNGRDAPTEEIGSRGVDRWSFRSKDGTKISILEEQQGSAVLKMEVPGGVSAELSQSSGGKLELKTTGNTITLDQNGITIRGGGEVTVQGSTITMRAGQLTVNSAMAQFSGAIQAASVTASAIVGTLYTPGAGNVW